MISREEMKSILRDSFAVVVFEKSDGTVRNMLGTTMSEYLPKVESTTSDKPKKPENENVVTLFDLVKKEWRSFRVDKAISFEGTPPGFVYTKVKHPAEVDAYPGKWAIDRIQNFFEEFKDDIKDSQIVYATPDVCAALVMLGAIDYTEALKNPDDLSWVGILTTGQKIYTYR